MKTQKHHYTTQKSQWHFSFNYIQPFKNIRGCLRTYRVTWSSISKIRSKLWLVSATFWLIFHPENLKHPLTARKLRWHISFNYLQPFITIGDVWGPTEWHEVRFRRFWANGTDFGSFLTNFPPWKPKNTLRLLKNHTGTSVLTIYNHS